MPNYGISELGFARKRLSTILDDLNAEMKSIFGENFNVEPESPDGQINGVISESQANLWEIAEEAYNAFDPSKATGDSLSNLVQLNGLVRTPAVASTSVVDLVGTAGTLIPAASIISTSDSKTEFLTDVDVTLDGGGLGSVAVTARDTGPIAAVAGTIVTIDSPITGWDSATNPADATLGSVRESDPDLRARRERSVARDAQAIVDAIFAAVAAVPSVTQLVVLENDTDSGPDANGLPAHSTHVIAVGGDDQDIGEAIFVKKTPGVTSFGSTTVQVADAQGIDHPIGFSRPIEVPIHVVVNITQTTGFPADGEDQIKQNIVDYTNGDLVAGRGFFLSGDVIWNELYTPINQVVGHTVDSLFIKTSEPADATADIPIAIGEVSQFTIANIDVTVA